MLQHQTSSSTPTSLQPVQQLQQQQQQHFARGDKASVSVRLRKKKSEGNNVNNHRRLANSRHSGDFSFFSSAQLHQHHHLPAVPIRKKMEDETDANSKGDWAYITFPNGVPQVHEIQTNGEQQQQPQQQQQQVVTNGAAGPANRTPVKVVTREVPGILPLNPRLFASSHALNNNEVIIPHPNQPPSYEQARKRQSGDFSHFRHQRQLSVEQQQRLYNGGGSQQQQQQQQQNRRQSMDPSQMRKSTKGFLETDLNSSPSTRRHHYRRKSEQHHHHHSNNNNKSSKRCSGEFQFTQPQQQQQQQEQEEVVVMRRQPGLGRRAATQIEIEQKRKNSYNAALYKSQENLVKVSIVRSSFRPFRQPRLCMKLKVTLNHSPPLSFVGGLLLHNSSSASLGLKCHFFLRLFSLPQLERTRDRRLPFTTFLIKVLYPGTSLRLGGETNFSAWDEQEKLDADLFVIIAARNHDKLSLCRLQAIAKLVEPESWAQVSLLVCFRDIFSGPN